MKSTALTDTRIEVLEGSVILEAAEIQKEHSIELAVGGSVVAVKKRTTFRLDVGTPPRVRVYDGEVAVVEPGRPVNVKEGKQLAFTSVPVVEKFDKEETDPFYRWAGRRSGYIALANASASRRVYDENIPWQVGGWYFNPFFGMFTYIPQRGRYTNAWNHYYRSPAPAYHPQPLPDYNSGMYSAARGSFDTGGRGASTGVYQAPAVSSRGRLPHPRAAPAPARSGDAGSSRGGGGGHGKNNLRRLRYDLQRPAGTLNKIHRKRNR